MKSDPASHARYADRYATGEWRAPIFRDMVVDTAATAQRGLTILDIGCGGGFDGDAGLQDGIARFAERFIGIEPDPEISLAASFTETHRSTLEDAPLTPGSIDIAYSVMVLEHLERPERFWRRIAELLADDGVFWGFTVDRRHYFSLCSLLLEKLRVKDLYLTAFRGRRGEDRYENYPVYYRCNTPRQIRRQTADLFRQLDFVSFSRATDAQNYVPRPVRPLVRALNRCLIAAGAPGHLLAVRASR